MTLEVIWTSGAERDLVEIYRWLYEALPDEDDLVARMLQIPLGATVNLLTQHPEIGARVKGAKGFRRRLFGPQMRYGLFYVVERRGIVIHALLDMRRDPEDLWKRLRGNG